MMYGKRIRFRGVEKSDLQKFHEWINDPEVTEGLLANLPMSLADEERWFERTSLGEQAEKPLAIEIKEKRGWWLIGNCGLFHIEWMNSTAEFGIMIGDKSAWNKGYGTEAVELILQHGFETLNLNSIYLRVHSTNLRAKRVYEKTGFILDGMMRQAVYKHGKYVDVHFMSVLRSEWNARQEKR
ncbi:MAG: GNAT family N-acetyltransferase [Chloroflexi bacterium]|nr:GNAT family N-acetyltransferase [Chloroflexota bacterium]